RRLRAFLRRVAGWSLLIVALGLAVRLVLRPPGHGAADERETMAGLVGRLTRSAAALDPADPTFFEMVKDLDVAAATAEEHVLAGDAAGGPLVDSLLGHWGRKPAPDVAERILRVLAAAADPRVAAVFAEALAQRPDDVGIDVLVGASEAGC